MWAFYIYMLKYFTQSNWTFGLTNIQEWLLHCQFCSNFDFDFSNYTLQRI